MIRYNTLPISKYLGITVDHNFVHVHHEHEKKQTNIHPFN